MTTLVNINNSPPYKAILRKNNVCHKMTHIIKIDDYDEKKKINGNIYLNNDKTNKYGPVVTLSTNTDSGRNLSRDSFGIIKFIDDTDDLVDKCVECDSDDEKEIKKNKKLSKINRLKNTILNLVDESIKGNNLYKHSELKQYISKFFYPNEILTLEIYEFLLKDYPEDLSEMNLITKSIDVSSDDTCGIIETTNSVKSPPSNDPRSCDPISGEIINNPTKVVSPLTPSDNINYDFSLNVNGQIINSSDLIKFTNIFGAKQSNRVKIDPLGNRIESMDPLYTQCGIEYIFNSVTSILENQWIINKGDPTRLDDFYENNSLIKILKPDEYQQFIVIGDLHGSFATFIRILLRFRKMGIMNENGILINDHHVIFLGDVVDRGVYGYEIMMLLYCLNILNPNNIHINRGNHEEEITNTRYGLRAQLQIQFSSNNVFYDMNKKMIRQSSAILIRNPLNDRYIYLAHGGLPTNNSYILDPIVDKINFKNKCLIVSDEIGNNIRWNDFESTLKTLEGERNAGSSVIIGYDIIEEAQSKGIELIIRGHQDHPINTKLLPLYDPTKPYTKQQCSIC